MATTNLSACPSTSEWELITVREALFLTLFQVFTYKGTLMHHAICSDNPCSRKAVTLKTKKPKHPRKHSVSAVGCKRK